MRKLNPIIYHKLILQAREAKFQHLTKLSSAILAAVGPVPEDEDVKYEYAELQEEVYQGLWKIGTHVVKYYDVSSADVSRIHDRIEALSNKFIEEMKLALDIDNRTTDSKSKLGENK